MESKTGMYHIVVLYFVCMAQMWPYYVLAIVHNFRYSMEYQLQVYIPSKLAEFPHMSDRMIAPMRSIVPLPALPTVLYRIQTVDLCDTELMYVQVLEL